MNTTKPLPLPALASSLLENLLLPLLPQQEPLTEILSHLHRIGAPLRHRQLDSFLS